MIKASIVKRKLYLVIWTDQIKFIMIKISDSRTLSISLTHLWSFIVTLKDISYNIVIYDSGIFDCFKKFHQCRMTNAVNIWWFYVFNFSNISKRRVETNEMYWMKYFGFLSWGDK